MVTSLHSIGTPLTATDVDTTQAAHLGDLQGNILKFHGRPHAQHLFLQFTPSEQHRTRAWIRQLVPRLTTAHAQLAAAQIRRQSGKDAGVFQVFFLSAKGYQYFDKDLSLFDDQSFKSGSKSSIQKLADPPEADWEAGFQSEIHAMLLIADESQARLRFMTKVIEIELSGFATIVLSQPGDQQFNARGDGIEHFGYVDGRSQPLMLERDLRGEPEGTTLWDPRAGPAQVLVTDPFGEPHSSGSYFVFRKLEEKVRDFKTQEQVLASKLGLTGDARELAGALVIGRFEDGTPVALSPQPVVEDSALPNAKSVPNNFTYSHDLNGSRCPFQSHIRKSNPRGSGPGGLQDEKTRHMARRGMTYGDREANTFDCIADMPDGDVGLLFMSYQRSIVTQFEFIQQNWVNNVGFPAPGTGLDPVIGQSNAPAPSMQNWPMVWGNQASGTLPFDFRDFVLMRGGEYFFSPSLASLRTI